MNENILTFEKSYPDGKPISIQVGRIYLGMGHWPVRLMMLPDGLHLAVDSNCPFVHLMYQGENEITGLGTFVMQPKSSPTGEAK